MKRPPKEFMEATGRAIETSGTAEKPEAVAAATWTKMSEKARAPWKVLDTLRATGAEIVPGNPGPLVLPMAASAASRAGETIARVVTGDIIVIRSVIPRGTKKNPKPPLLLETHINLAAIGIGAFFIALAALVGTAAWHGWGSLRGIRDTEPEGWFPGLDATIALIKRGIGLG